jgi:hypothetical protein
MQQREYRIDGGIERVKQFVVMDPDGYLIRVSQSFGVSPQGNE